MPAIFVCFGMLALTLLQSCGDDDFAIIFSTTLILQNDSGQTATLFSQGESITLVLTIRNLTNSFQTITLPNAQIYDFVVLQTSGGPIIWRWGQGTLPVITQVNFTPMEEKIFSAVWDQTDNNGIPVGPGGYVAQGFIATSENLATPTGEPSETRSPLVLFMIQ